ncbi:ectoine hydroxylase-related dioxygenase (phytanoyl-CoA dioxygenase family) [Lentzea atacamensis]|uniref:Ectoine hydroxylase-related dioxygenase (Phytanoyl-CoA dioxygenase family) n=1 Tax=Lentzea atacamensis TaxID=531938 RepID=A0A316HL26_9PSEU|nr:phytanoyl-CoA dioxygenase family protein [Lentzea atacamensis]PWK80681.1 ectoine hydroxylase-related dioxygenase (phytanoyl-CoA dioxygenase family) [Lentzea atacamensis]
MSAPLFQSPNWFSSADCDLASFRAVVEQVTDIGDYPHADSVDQGVLIYGEKCDATALAGAGRAEVQAELANALGTGPGVVVFKRAFTADVVDRASAVFFDLIDRQKSSAVSTGDHFAAPGSNDRLWSAIEKLAIVDPETFCDYFSNDVIALVSTAWLGPNYQIVSEPNSVNPGSRPQVGHRDYHLGLMDIDYASRFPAHVHRFSSALTLQAAVAQVDMPIETGPTMYLPHSQKFDPGYLAVNLPDFQQWFTEKRSQLPLDKGDVVFFNPAVMHGAGANRTTDVKRMANLLQISSAFGRAAATVDTESIVAAIYPVLRARRAAGVGDVYVENVLTAAAEGYPFPTNLDRDKPIGSLFPESQLDLAKRALADEWDQDRLVTALAEQAERRRSSLAK